MLQLQWHSCYRRLSCSLQLTSPPFGQLLCPFSQLHSTAPHSFHSTMFVANHIASVPGILPPLTLQIGQDAQSLSQLQVYSLGSITLLRRFFISAGFSPPAAFFYFARRSPHLGCVHLAAANAHSSLISQSIAKVHLHSSAPFVSASWRKIYSGGFLWCCHLAPQPALKLGECVAFYCQPLCGGSPSASIQSCLPLSSGRKWLAIPSVRASVPHSYASFLPQALLPGILRKFSALKSIIRPSHYQIPV